MSQSGTYSIGGGGGGSDILTITGNNAIPVGPDGAGNIDLLGVDPISVDGNAGLNTLFVSVASATTGQIGVVLLATDAEAIAGADTAKAIVPSSLSAKLGDQTQFGIAFGDGTNMPIQWTAAGTDGQLIIGATGAAPAFADLTSSGGTITITPGANTLNIDVASGGGMLQWTEVTGTSANMAVNNGYIANNAGLVTLTLPVTAVIGDIIRVTGKGTGGWSIAQNAGQTIFFGTSTTTTGVAGSLDSTEDRDTVELVCVTANDDWNVLSSVGNITVV